MTEPVTDPPERQRIDQAKLDARRKRHNENVRRYRQRRKKRELASTQDKTRVLFLPPATLQPVAEEDEPIRVRFPKFYTAQQEFLDLLDKKKRVCIRAGRQYGKSMIGIAGMARRIYNHPNPMGVGWVVSPTYPMAEQLRYKIEDILSPLIVDKREGNVPVYFFEPPPGAKRPYRVEIKTAEKPDRLRGATLDWLWLDEARNMDRSIWPIIVPTVAVSRGPIFVTTTPAGKDWVWEKFGKPAEEGDPDFGVVVARSGEAAHFTDADISSMRSQMSAEMARQELDADIIAFDGLVYPQFNTDIHVVDPLAELPQGASVIGGVDFGWKDPFVHLWVAKHEGRFIVFDEYYRSGQFIQDHAAAIKGHKWHGRVSRRWADPSGPQMMAELSLKGVSTYPANNDIKMGLDAVKRLLEQRKLFVTRNCVNTIREFSQYHYPDKKENNTKDVPADSFNHALDSLRYVVYNEQNYQLEGPYAYVGDDGVMKEFDIPQGGMSQWMTPEQVKLAEGWHEDDGSFE